MSRQITINTILLRLTIIRGELQHIVVKQRVNNCDKVYIDITLNMIELIDWLLVMVHSIEPCGINHDIIDIYDNFIDQYNTLKNTLICG